MGVKQMGRLRLGHLNQRFTIGRNRQEGTTGLHLDHNYELAQICHVWRGIIARLGRPLRSWDDGVNGELICQLLFGVESHRNLRRTGNPLWDANVQFRCGRAQNRRRSDDHVYCHDTDYPHYAWVLAESDVRA